MSLWQRILDGLVPTDHAQVNSLLDVLRSLGQAPEVFWYPASARDLVPLLLDVPDNPTGKRLLRLNATFNGTPRILWMNDLGDDYVNFPESDLLGCQFDTQCYAPIWDEYRAKAWFGPSKESYVFNDCVPVTLFTVRVENASDSSHPRGKDGDEYLVCFSSCSSSALFKNLFVPGHLKLPCIALIKNASFDVTTNERRSHYDALPIAVMENENAVGQVDLWVLDIDGQQGESRTPYADCLQDYEYVGGPLRWGWVPTRIFARRGAHYVREQRPRRVSTSWGR